MKLCIPVGWIVCLDMANSDASSSTTCTVRVLLSFYVAATDDSSSPGGTPIWNRRGCSSEILNLTPKGDHLGAAQAFCDP